MTSSLLRKRPRIAQLRSRGTALVIVVSLLAVLGVIAAGYAGIAHEETVLARRHLDTTASRYLAEAGLHLTIASLLSADAASVPADGRLRALSVDGHDVLVSVRTAAGLVDINLAGEATLRSVLTAAGADRELAATLAERALDWRDADSRAREHGAEDRDYVQRGMAWTARDDRFVTVDELRYLLDMPEPLFLRVSPYLTVYSGHADVDLSAAPEFLVRALGERATRVSDAGFEPRGGSGIFHINVGVPAERGAFVSMEAVVMIAGGTDYSILEWREVSRFLTRGSPVA